MTCIIKKCKNNIFSYLPTREQFGSCYGKQNFYEGWPHSFLSIETDVYADIWKSTIADMSLYDPTFIVQWDEVLAMVETDTDHAAVNGDSNSVHEISKQELLFEIALDSECFEGLDISMFDQPMEELDPTIVSLDAAGSGIEGEMTLPMTSMIQEEPSAPELETNENIQLHEENQQPSTSKIHQQNQFIELDAEDVRDFVKKQENRSTLRKTIGDIEKLNQFFKIKGENREMKDIPPVELDILVSNFILSVRKADGSEYEPTTIRNMISSFDRKLRRHSYPESIINSKTAFTLTKDTLKAKLKSLKKQGKGNRPKEAKPITDTEIGMLYEQNILGGSSPRALINTMWMNNTIHFGLRGITEHYDLRWGDISLQCTSDGKEYLEFNERQSKTLTGENTADIRKVTPKMYSTDKENDPVNLYKLYRDKRPQDYSNSDDPFYIAPRTTALKKDTDPWFLRQKVGMKKLGSIMKMMALKGGLDPNKRLTNHSARKHLVQKLRDNNIPPTDIMQMTGHRNVQSVINYSSISDKRQLECSAILSNHTNLSPSQSHTQTQHQMQLPVSVPASVSGISSSCTIPSVENSNGPSNVPLQVSPTICPLPTTHGDLSSYPSHSNGMQGLGSQTQISLTRTHELQSMFYGATLNISNMNVYCSPQSAHDSQRK